MLQNGQKAQGAIEFLIQYSWEIVILLVALSSVLLIAIVQHQLSTTPSYCYISPELNCYRTTIAVNASGSSITTFFTNSQDHSIVLTSYTVAPSSSSGYYPGVCNATLLQPGQNAECVAFITGFLPQLGSQVNPIFYVQYSICNGPCSNVASQIPVSTEGTAVTSALPNFNNLLSLSTTVSTATSTILVSSSTLSTLSSSTLSSSTLSSTTTLGVSSTTTVGVSSTTTVGASSTTTVGLSTTTVGASTTTIGLSTTTVGVSSTTTVGASSTTTVGVSSTTTVGLSTTTTIQYYTVTLYETPAAADTTWQACFTDSVNGQACNVDGSNSVSELVPSGSTITGACTAQNFGSGPYTFTGWTGAFTTATPCPSPGTVVTGPLTIVANYGLASASSSSTTTTSCTQQTDTLFSAFGNGAGYPFAYGATRTATLTLSSYGTIEWINIAASASGDYNIVHGHPLASSSAQSYFSYAFGNPITGAVMYDNSYNAMNNVFSDTGVILYNLYQNSGTWYATTTNTFNSTTSVQYSNVNLGSSATYDILASGLGWYAGAGSVSATIHFCS